MPNATCQKCRKRFAYKAAEVRTKPRCHKVLGGDSTSPADVARVMDGEQAAMIWTDPPFGVGYVGKTKAALTIENDTPSGLREFLVSALVACTDALEPGAAFYLAAPAGPLGTEFRLALSDAGWKFHQCLVWVKDTMVLGHSDYHYRHEDILYGWLPGPGRSGRGGDRWNGDNSQTSVFEIPRPKRSEEHPTMKPPELVAAHARNSSVVGDILLDVFLGSGTSAVVGEQHGRLVYGLEIDPKYLAVALERLAAMGLEPRLAPGG